MKYTQPSFSVPPANLRNGTNRHGQTWEDIWNPHTQYSRDEVRKLERELEDAAQGQNVFTRTEFAESVPDATGDSLNKERQDEVSLWESEHDGCL